MLAKLISFYISFWGYFITSDVFCEIKSLNLWPSFSPESRSLKLEMNLILLEGKQVYFNSKLGSETNCKLDISSSFIYSYDLSSVTAKPPGFLFFLQLIHGAVSIMDNITGKRL